MDWLSDIAEWANANEGLLQALAMLGGIAALLISLRRQRAGAAAREPLPAKLVVRPLSPAAATQIAPLLAGYGGQATSNPGSLTASFDDADDAARAALGGQATRPMSTRILKANFRKSQSPSLS